MTKLYNSSFVKKLFESKSYNLKINSLFRSIDEYISIAIAQVNS